MSLFIHEFESIAQDATAINDYLWSTFSASTTALVLVVLLIVLINIFHSGHLLHRTSDLTFTPRTS